MYTEEFRKSFVEKDKIDYVIFEVKKMYPEESGWSVSEPEIIDNGDGKTVTMIFQLTKELERSGRRGR